MYGFSAKGKYIQTVGYSTVSLFRAMRFQTKKIF